MNVLIDQLLSWPAFYLFVAIFVADLVLDHYTSSLSVFEILPSHVKAYAAATPVALALAILSILPIPKVFENFTELFFISFSPFLLLIACYYKDKLSDLGEDEDYQSHWLMKFGLLIMGLAIVVFVI